MTTVLDSQIFTNIFSTAAIKSVWSDHARTTHYLRFEAALAKVQAELDIIPSNAAEKIVRHARDPATIDYDLLRQQTELIGYPVLGVVKQLVAAVNADVGPNSSPEEAKYGEFAHWGATTQDVTDTAVVLQLRESLVLIEKEVDGIITVLRGLAHAHRTTPMAARSNLQQAVPMSFGFKMARLLATFARHRERLGEARRRLLVVQFGGAAGTLATISRNEEDGERTAVDGVSLGLKCQELLAQELGLGVPSIAWHTERDNLAEVSNFLAVLTATCAKFATDLKLMMQSEVDEAREPYVPHRGSSSTMPQKRNPIGSAYICSMASSVRSMANGMTEAVVADHERSTGPWEIEWVLLPQVCALSHACLQHTHQLLSGMEVDEKNMRRNLDLSNGAIVSEAVMMGLGKHIGRQYAHDLVYDVCRKAQLTGRPLLELLSQDEEIQKAGLAKSTLEELCQPANYLGLSATMVDRVLQDTE